MKNRLKIYHSRKKQVEQELTRLRESEGNKSVIKNLALRKKILLGLIKNLEKEVNYGNKTSDKIKRESKKKKTLKKDSGGESDCQITNQESNKIQEKEPRSENS